MSQLKHIELQLILLQKSTLKQAGLNVVAYLCSFLCVFIYLFRDCPCSKGSLGSRQGDAFQLTLNHHVYVPCTGFL
jgi:hypothetical protein